MLFKHHIQQKDLLKAYKIVYKLNPNLPFDGMHVKMCSIEWKCVYKLFNIAKYFNEITINVQKRFQLYL